LRYLFGAPKSWEFSGPDEQVIRGLLKDLDLHTADIETRSAVLVATTDEGLAGGAWNRAGTAALAAAIKRDSPGPS
jgi:hypothetical protein